MSRAYDEVWSRISSVWKLEETSRLAMYKRDRKCCRCKMKGKRSKSLSPEPSGSQDYKRSKIEADDFSFVSERTNFLDFSDDVLLNIMKYLHPQDLMALSLCCKRLDRVCQDRTLWKIIDCRYTAMAMDDLEKYIKFLQPSTTCVALRGSLVSNPALGPNFLTAVNTKCKNLKEFIIEECNINAQDVQICDFPPTVEKLSFKGCALHNFNTNKSYFFKINLHMLNLTCLILSHCSWVTSHSLLVISKIPNLRELRLDSCRRLSECVAYASLATRFGFKTLEILDLRDTALGDSEICCFSSTKTLTHIYLECPSKSRNRTVYRYNRGQESAGNIEGQPVYEDPYLVQYIVDDDAPWHDMERCLISDRAVCALGTSVRHRRVIVNPLRDILHNQRDVMFEEDIWASNHPNLKTLVVRNYSRVTNQSLIHLAASASSLEFLDVTGTSVTKEGVQTFKTAQPNVKIISSFNEE